MSKGREWIRKYARRDNWFGFSCSVFVYLFRKGPREAGKLITERHRRNRERRNAWRLLQIPEEELRRQRETSFDAPVLISVITPLYNTPAPFLREMIESVLAQTYSHWELCLADGSDDARGEVGEICNEYSARDPRIKYKKLQKNEGISANTNACLQMASGDYAALLDHDDLLMPNALFECAHAILATGSDFLYSDEYVFVSPSVKAVLRTHFKPDFAPESLLTNNYICHLSVFSFALLEKAGRFRPEFDGSQDHDLILRLTNAAEKNFHIPKPLYLWRSHIDSVASDISTKAYAIEAGKNSVRSFLESQGIHSRVNSVPSCPTMYHVRYLIHEEPSVCIVLDLSNAPKPEDAVVEQIQDLKKHSGLNRIIFVVLCSPGSVSGHSHSGAQWINTSEPNRPMRLNEAVRSTNADYCLLLDPDLKCDSNNWLREMLMLAQQHEIGAVGARILLDNRRVRHAGLVLGMGRKHLVGRLFFRSPEDETGNFGRLTVVQNLSAVSSECMLFNREKYEQAGGFSDAYQDVLFDVDFCLKLSNLGYRNLYCPFSQFVGGRSRHFSIDYAKQSKAYEKDAAVFRTHWSEKLAAPDPFFNPNPSLDHADYRTRRLRA